MTCRPSASPIGAAVLLLLGALPALATSVLPGFVVEDAVPGVTFDVPTGMAFLPDGRLLVAEKRGRLWAVDHGARHPTPMWEGEAAVLDQGDRGLLDVGVDPNYLSNHFIYLLYTVDPDSDGVDPYVDAYARLARYTVSFTDPKLVEYDSRRILFGDTWRTGPASGSGSHTIGSIRWGRDGSMLVSVGDGANWTGVDAGGRDPELFGPDRTDPVEDIGAFRAQYIGSLAGKILRIDPANGLGYPSNPYWDGDPASVRSRVWCYGLRNPFRFTVKPNTGSTDPAAGNPGTLYLADVGMSRFEELNVAKTGGLNFGWPCREGLLDHPEYQAANPIHHGCDSLGLGDNTGTLTDPIIAIHHYNAAASTPPGFTGSAVIGGVFYVGGFYPAAYTGLYFFGDYSQDWLCYAETDASDELVRMARFSVDPGGPVDFQLDPTSGDVLYVSILSGKIRRIRWAQPIDGNLFPVAIASGAPGSGSAPHTVSFSSAGSHDPDGDPYTFSWNFGDGYSSTSPNPIHTYTSHGAFNAILTLEDGAGGWARDTVSVLVTDGGGFPASAVLDDFNRTDGALGGAWIGDVTGATIDKNAATSTCCDVFPVWDGPDAAFGPDQEAYLTFTTITPAPVGLMLKVQGTIQPGAHIEARYLPARGIVRVLTHGPDGSTNLRGEFPALFAAGDQLGARVFEDDLVQVFKNGKIIGTCSAADGSNSTLGGRIGFTLGSSVPPRVDDFGGGNVPVNTPPEAIILAPANGAFFIAGQPIRLLGTAADAQQAANTLAYEWRVNLHHNTHVHPSIYTTFGTTASFNPADEEDGTGFFYELELRVTDVAGLVNTARVSVYPEVDLAAGRVMMAPKSPGTSPPTTWSTWIHNRGHNASRVFRWTLVADGALLAEGDTAVAALDSVRVSGALPPTLPTGRHSARFAADTSGIVVEMDESNNAWNGPIAVINGTGIAGEPPAGAPSLNASPPSAPTEVALSNAWPIPSRGSITLALELPKAARVEFSVLDLLGRRVWEQPARVYPSGRWGLGWEGRTDNGSSAANGIYLARVTVDGRPFVRRIAHLR